MNFKLSRKALVWIFLIVGVLLISTVITLSIKKKQKAERIAQHVKQPEVNDILHIKKNDSTYTLYKISKVVRDSIYFSPNRYETDTEHGLGGEEMKDYNTSAVFVMPRQLLLDMYKRQQVLDVTK